MITLNKLAIAVGLCATGMLAVQSASAQTTDAYHTIQVFPVVVDTASFTQRFHFRNPNSTTITISPSYFPGTGTAQATAITCPSFTIPANTDRTFTSLRGMCGALAAGSNFGFLYTFETNAANMPYAAFSRVANPQGNGFSVEAFPAETFTSADSIVTGVRRLAASGGNPAYQTNCFVANLNDMQPEAPEVVTSVDVSVYSSAGIQLGATTPFLLAPGKLTRLLDVFTAVGLPGGNYDNARVMFHETGDREPGLMSFCTVQDNTSFGADFRIAKAEVGTSHLGSYNFALGPQDDSSLRSQELVNDVPMSLAFGTSVTRNFEIGTGGLSSNTHVMYFKHPDYVQCRVVDPATNATALTTYGLEMRMVADDGLTVIAGGSDITAFGEVYLGDKRSRNLGANTRYTIEVEANGFNGGVVRPYRLHCQSGSGHTGGDILRYKEATDRF